MPPTLPFHAAVLRAASAAVLCASALQAQAQTSGPAVGLGLMARQTAYLGTDRELRGVPLLHYENTWLRLSGLQAELKVPRHTFNEQHAVSGGLRLRYELDGYDPDDAAELAGMERRRGSVWVGLAGTWHNPWVDLSLEVLGDASRHSEGTKAQMQFSRRFVVDRFALTPRVQVDWLNSEYVDYYYGVTSAEARAGRAAYTGRSATTQSLGMRVDYSLTAQHQVFLDLNATRLPDEIRASPLIDRRGTARSFLGYLYRF